MLTYIDAAMSALQECNEFNAQELRHGIKSGLEYKTQPEKRLAECFKITRFDMVLDSLKLIRDELAVHMEKEIIPKYGINVYTPVKKSKGKPRPTPKKQAKKPSPIKPTPHRAKAPTLLPEAAAVAAELIALPSAKASSQPIPANVVSPALLASSAPTLPAGPTLHLSSPIVPTTLQSPAVIAAPVTVASPAAVISSAAMAPPAAALNENPKLLGLNKRHQETYEQIFADRWSAAKNIGLDAVDKLIRRLGGQTKGVGGSRTQIIFNNKSVATIEHRHGRDKARELYKVSVSLLQRGLGIAGFAPKGWEDELSRSYALINGLRKYQAEQHKEDDAKRKSPK
jgi:hypothetical protein